MFGKSPENVIKKIYSFMDESFVSSIVANKYIHSTVTKTEQYIAMWSHYKWREELYTKYWQINKELEPLKQLYMAKKQNIANSIFYMITLDDLDEIVHTIQQNANLFRSAFDKLNWEYEIVETKNGEQIYIPETELHDNKLYLPTNKYIVQIWRKKLKKDVFLVPLMNYPHMTFTFKTYHDGTTMIDCVVSKIGSIIEYYRYVNANDEVYKRMLEVYKTDRQLAKHSLDVIADADINGDGVVDMYDKI